MDDSYLWQLINSLQARIEVLEAAAGITPDSANVVALKAPVSNEQPQG